MKWFNLLVVVALLALIGAGLVLAQEAFADGPMGEGSPLSQSNESCPVVAKGKGGDGPIQAQRQTEYNGPNGQGQMNAKREGPEELELACHFKLGEVYRPYAAVEQWVSQGHATWGACPDVQEVITTTNTTPVLYTVYLPFVANGHGTPEPVTEDSEKAMLVRVTTVTTRTHITTYAVPWERVDTIYTITTVTRSTPNRGGIPLWVLVLIAMALPIMVRPALKVRHAIATIFYYRLWRFSRLWSLYYGIIYPWLALRKTNIMWWWHENVRPIASFTYQEPDSLCGKPLQSDGRPCSICDDPCW